jgi:GntR family transcriptional regulator/MocR family aminotransferase
MEAYDNMFVHRVQSASKLEQYALAELLQSGDFGRHIRKIRNIYKQKNKKLKDLCEKHIGEEADCIIPDAGLSMVMELKKEVEIQRIYDLSYELNVNILPLSHYMVKNDEKSLEKFLVLNYRGISEGKLEDGIMKIKELLCQLY